MEIHIGDRVAEVELVSKEDNKVVLTIDGKPFEADVVMAENGTCNILMDGRSANAQLIRKENGKSYKVNTHYSSFNVEIVDSQAKYLRMRKKGEDEQNDRITSPMPGKVVKIPVTAGQEVKAGDTAIVIEAMKMQSNYKVTSDCRIKEILVQEGDNITGDVIAFLNQNFFDTAIRSHFIVALHLHGFDNDSGVSRFYFLSCRYGNFYYFSRHGRSDAVVLFVLTFFAHTQVLRLAVYDFNIETAVMRVHFIAFPVLLADELRVCAATVHKDVAGSVFCHYHVRFKRLSVNGKYHFIIFLADQFHFGHPVTYMNFHN